MLMYFIPCLEKYSQSEARLPLRILRYATGNMQRVVFHSTFQSLLARNSKASSGTLQLLRTITNTSDHVRKFSEDFPKILKNHKNI